MAAAFAAGLPGVGGELKAGAREGPIVDLRGDPAERGHVLLRQPGFQPRIAQRTGVELDVQPFGVIAEDFGLEHAAVVGHPAQEGRFQSGQIAGCELGVLLPPPQLASPVDRLREQFFGPIGAELCAARRK